MDIAGGEHHSAAVTAEGSLYTWGRADLGVLGISGEFFYSITYHMKGVKGLDTLSLERHT